MVDVALDIDVIDLKKKLRRKTILSVLLILQMSVILKKLSPI